MMEKCRFSSGRWSALKSLFIAAAIAAVLMIFCSATVYAAPGAYVHDPVLNATAMADIIVDDDAVYGYRPDPASDRLGSFSDIDWTDSEIVEECRQQRIEYHNQFSEMYDKWQEMEAEGCDIEEIARTVSRMRNEIRLASYDGDPEGLKRVKASNLEKYGNEDGPDPDYLYEKYGSWETVLIKSFSENPGMDACLGLYDDYYEHYIEVGSLKELKEQTYTVRSGDTLCKIASKYYGDSCEWKSVYEQNQSFIDDPDLIYEGMELAIHVE